MYICTYIHVGFLGGAIVRNLSASAGDTRDACLIPGLGKSHGVGSSNLLQYSCLENSMDRRDWQATVQGITESDSTEHTHTHARMHVRAHTHARMHAHTHTHAGYSPGYHRVRLDWTHTHTHTHTHILFYILFPYGLSQNVEYNSLCCKVGWCCLSILYITVCIC